MAALPLDLSGHESDRSLRGAIAGFTAVGLGGALAGGGFSGRRFHGRRHRARATRVPGNAVSFGYRWRFADEWTPTWWPQGIAVGEHEGVPLALVSWYAQPRRGVEMGSRVSVVNLTNPRRPTYRHVLLVEPANTGGGVVPEPVLAHAGGIVWSGDRLLVAATYDGIREFRLSDILRAEGARGPFGYDLVLPQFAHHRAVDPSATGRMRYSFVGLETGAEAVAPDALKLVAGEFHQGDARRVARLTHTPDRTVVDETHAPRIAQMQGVALHDGTWYISASRGDRRGGDLWSGSIENLHRHESAVPPGPEDLAVWPGRGELWSVSEPRGKRWLYAMDLARLT